MTTGKLIVPAHLQKKPRRFILEANLNAEVEGSFDDWPAQMQDMVMEALNRCAKKNRVALQLIGATCAIDYGETSDKDRPYAIVIAEEMIGTAYSETEH